MSLRPTAIAMTATGGMYVVIDDPGDLDALLIPCSFEHRRVTPRSEVADLELHPGRDPAVERELANVRAAVWGALQLIADQRTAQGEQLLRSCLPDGYAPVGA